MKTVLIYVLIDPRDNQIKYIGKTSQLLKQRLYGHIVESKKSNTKKNTWIQSLKVKGLKPLIEELDIVSELEWEFWEKYWIAQFKSWGFELKNMDDGGRGMSSEFMKKNNPMFKKEVREKLSQSLMGNQFAKGFKHTKETKKKVSENSAKFWLGKNRDIETLKKLKRGTAKSVKVLYKDKIVVFDSINSTAKSLNLDKNTISMYIKNKKICKLNNLNVSFEFEKAESYVQYNHNFGKGENYIGDKNHFYNKHHDDKTKEILRIKCSKIVNMLNIKQELIKTFDSAKMAGKELNLDNSTIGKYIKNKKFCLLNGVNAFFEYKI